MDKMKVTAKNIVDDTFLETVWLSKLPEMVAAVVSGQEGKLTQKGRVADRVMEKRSLNFEAAPIEAQSTQAAPVSDINARFVCALENMEKQIAQLALRTRSRSPSAGRNNQRAQNPPRIPIIKGIARSIASMEITRGVALTSLSI